MFKICLKIILQRIREVEMEGSREIQGKKRLAICKKLLRWDNKKMGIHYIWLYLFLYIIENLIIEG